MSWELHTVLTCSLELWWDTETATWGERVHFILIIVHHERAGQGLSGSQGGMLLTGSLCVACSPCFFAQLSTTCLEWYYPYSNHQSRQCPADLPLGLSDGGAMPWIEVPTSHMTPLCIINLTKKLTSTQTNVITNICLGNQNTKKHCEGQLGLLDRPVILTFGKWQKLRASLGYVRLCLKRTTGPLDGSVGNGTCYKACRGWFDMRDWSKEKHAHTLSSDHRHTHMQ